jgi:TRAP-type C4-dicarboxylate transport system permease small subunit
MNVFKWIDAYLEEAVTVVLFSIITFVGIQQVFTRYLMSFVYGWAEELMRVCFVMLCLVGFALCEKKLQHVRVEILKLLVGPRTQWFLDLASSLVFVGFSVLLVRYSVIITEMQYSSGQITPAMSLPTWSYFVVGPVAFGLLVVRIVQREIIPLLARRKTVFASPSPRG